MYDPKISIIVPCYNDGIYLEECLNSVFNQTYTDWECIIIDNGSTDNTKEVTSYFVQKDKRFIYLYQANKGVSLARNNGIKQSHGKFILPLDADDRIYGTYLQKAVTVLENNEKIKVVYCEAEFFGEISAKWVMPEFSIKQMLFDNLIFCSAMFRRIDYDNTKGFDQSMVAGFEDWDFWLSLINDDKEVFRIPEVLFFYRIKKNSRNNSLDYEKKKMLRRQIYENHKEIYDSKLVTSDLIFDYYLNQIKYETLYDSLDYKIGKALLSPIRFIRKLLKK